MNEIFDPDRVDTFYGQPVDERQASLAENRATNYGVVRSDLLQSTYNALYTQRIHNPDSTQWQHQIHNYTKIVGAETTANGVRLLVKQANDGGVERICEFDAVLVAAGYKRDAHEQMLAPCQRLMPAAAQESGKCTVGRNYQVQFQNGAVNGDVGVWLQGCNEATHGVGLRRPTMAEPNVLIDTQLSDTLLSILATRGGELVQSIFGEKSYEQRAKL